MANDNLYTVPLSQTQKLRIAELHQRPGVYPRLENATLDNVPLFKEITLGEKLAELDSKFLTLMQRVLYLEEHMGRINKDVVSWRSTMGDVAFKASQSAQQLITLDQGVKTLQAFMLDVQEQMDEIWVEIREEE